MFLLDEHGDLLRGDARSFSSSGRSELADAETESIAAQVIAESPVEALLGVPAVAVVAQTT